jgi:hypothetical protein
MNYEQAYNVLNLKKETTKDEIIKRYDLLLKKYKLGTPILSTDGNVVDMSEVNQAYSVLMGQVSVDLQQLLPIKNNIILEKLGIDSKKAANFLHYHKYHILGVLLIIIFIVYVGVSCASYKKPDMNIGFIGEFYVDTELFKTKLELDNPNIKNVSIDSAAMVSSADMQYKSAMMQKEILLFAAEDIDLYIMDKASFEKYGKMGAFRDLDKIIGINKGKSYKLAARELKLKESKSNLTNYGLDLSKSKITYDRSILSKEIIVAIGVRAKNIDKTIKFINKFLGR